MGVGWYAKERRTTNSGSNLRTPGPPTFTRISAARADEVQRPSTAAESKLERRGIIAMVGKGR